MDGQCTGSSLPASGNNTNNAPWQETNGPKVFAGIEYDTYDNSKFAVTAGTFPPNSITRMTTPPFSLIGLAPPVNLNMYHAYNLNPGASINIEISTNGGSTYNTSLLNVASTTTALQLGINNATNPPTGSLQNVNISLNNYIGLSNLMIRFTYTGSTNSSWALDGVSIPPNGLNASFQWSQVTQNTPSLILPSNGTTVYANPTVTTTYQIATTVAGCPGGTQPVTVTVVPLPTIDVVAAVPKCYSPAAQTTTLPYTNAQNNPTKYTIKWNTSPANSFVNVTDANFPASGPFIINIPAGTLPGTYSGTLSVKNGNSCNSAIDNFTLTINPFIL